MADDVMPSRRIGEVAGRLCGVAGTGRAAGDQRMRRRLKSHESRKAGTSRVMRRHRLTRQDRSSCQRTAVRGTTFGAAGGW